MWLLLCSWFLKIVMYFILWAIFMFCDTECVLRWSLILIYLAWVWGPRAFHRSVGMPKRGVYGELILEDTVWWIHNCVSFACSPSSLWLHGLVFGRSTYLTGAGRICLHSQIVCCSGCHLSPVMPASVGSCQSLVLGDWRLQPASTHSMEVFVKGLVRTWMHIVLQEDAEKA